MTGTRHPVDRAVAGVRRVYRRRLWLVAVAAGAAVAAGVWVLAWILTGTGAWSRPTPAPLLAWAAAVAAWGAIAAWATRHYRAFDSGAAARAVEAAGGTPAGEVRSAVELASTPASVSGTLAARHRFRVGMALAGTPDSAMAAEALRALRRPTRWALVAAAALGALTLGPALVGGAGVAGAWAGLASPLAYLSAVPRPPLSLAVATREPRRGSAVPVEIGAEGRDSVALRWQPQAELARTRWLPVESGRAAAAAVQVDVPTSVWAEAADGARTQPLQLVPVDPLLLSELLVELGFPAYTGRPSEFLTPPFTPVTVPVGTRVRVEGRANRALATAELVGAGATPDVRLRVDGERFAGSFGARAGRWAWRIAAAEGEPLEFPPDTLALELVADSVPVVAIVYPGADTALAPEMVQPLVIDARDDYGIARAELVSWRVSAWGERHPPRVEPLDAGPSAEPRVVLEPLLDARERGFFPGDTLRYYARVWDNAPSPQEGRSREYVLRLPTLSELRDLSRAQLSDAMEKARELADAARERARETQALERSTREGAGRDPGGRGAGSQGIDFEATEAARRALEEGERLAQRVDEVRQALADVQQVLERAGLSDPELGQRLDELRSLYERVLTPEIRARLDELRRALQSLDPQALRDAVRRLAETTADLREQIDRSLKLLERVAMEQEFATLAEEARELSRRQEELAETAERRPDAASRAAQSAATDADSLVRRTDAFADHLRESGEPEAAERVEGAQQRLDVSASAARAGRDAATRSRGEASRQFQRGAQAAQEAAEQLESAREQVAAAWRQRVMDALHRAQAEALQLGDRQRELGESLRESADRAQARQRGAAIQRGLQAMAQSLAEASEGTLLLEPAVGGALQRAAGLMSELLQSLEQSSGSAEGAGQRSRAALESLNDLALSLMENRRALAAGGSGTGFEEALERLAELARQQGQLNQAAGGFNPLGVPLQMLGQQLQQLAQEQSAIGGALQELARRLGGRGSVLGQVDRLAEEADRIARELERGRLTPETMRRQEELFHRLLDAGRSLEREDVERERQAERPKGVPVSRPGPLPGSALRGPRFPRPSERELASYPPAYRRLILDYFDALNRGEGTGGAEPR